MSKKESFVFYTSVWPQLFNMMESDAERGQLIMAVIDYVSFNTSPSSDHSRAFIGAFEIMKEQIDKDTEKYQKKVEKNRESGKLGWQATAKRMASECQANGKRMPTDNDNDNVNDNEVISNDITKGAKTRKRFIKPTVEEVREYCQERGNTVDPDTFVNFYESKGWVVGKSPMKDWKAAVRNWERVRTETSKPPQETFSSFETDDFYLAALADSRRKMNNAENA